jgi:hypothetical protein
MNIMLAQAEAAVLQKAVEELMKQQPQNDSQYAMYLFMFALLIFGCGGFYVLRYMLTHTREIHDTSHKTIQSLSECFSEECQAARDQHHKDMVMSRDNVHDIRDVATIAVSAKDFAEKLQSRQDHKRPPASGTP